MIKSSAGEISRMLAQRVESFCDHLFGTGKKVGSEYCVGSISGESGDSLKVHLEGEKSGVWCDFATGESGDLLDLIRMNRNVGLPEAISYARGWLGIGSVSFASPTQKSYVRPQLEKEPEILEESPIKNYLVNQRKISVETLKVFRVGEKRNPDAIQFNFFVNDELTLIKWLKVERPNGKKQIASSPNSEPILYGWHTIPDNAREVVICEGEFDAMSLYQYGFPALSVPFGSGAHQWIESEYDRLSIFDKIYICFDDDDAGKKGASELIERLGRTRCYMATLPRKDANACLVDDISLAEIKLCFDQAKTLDPIELKELRCYIEKAKKLFYPDGGREEGMTLPWARADGKILLRPSELSIWSGMNGHGKSQALGQTLLHYVRAGEKVCIASMEIKAERLLYRLLRQATALRKPTEEYIDAVGEWMGDKMFIFDVVGTAKTERILDVFLYARQRYGIMTFVIDSFMKVGIAEEDYKSQKAFLEKLCDFKNEHNCHIHLVSHQRKSLDEKNVGGKMDMKGTGAVSDLADNCFIIWRNKTKEDIVNTFVQKGLPIPQDALESCDAKFSCDKQRNGEWEGKFNLWFHKESFQYLSYREQKPIQYVRYSNKAKIILEK